MGQSNDVVRKEIEERLAGHSDAHARLDLEAALQLYAEDAVVRPANMEPVRGHSALRLFFIRSFSVRHGVLNQAFHPRSF